MCPSTNLDSCGIMHSKRAVGPRQCKLLRRLARVARAILIEKGVLLWHIARDPAAGPGGIRSGRALLVLVLLAGLLFAAVYAYSRATGLQGSWWERTTALFHTVVQQIANLAPGQEDDPVAQNPYDASDFYQDGGYVRCTASPVSRTGIDVPPTRGRSTGRLWRMRGSNLPSSGSATGATAPGRSRRTTMITPISRARWRRACRSASHFYSQAITTAEAREEAQFVLDHLGGYEITYPVIFDWEQSSEAERTASLDNTALTDCAIAFCDTIEALGYRAGC